MPKHSNIGWLNENESRAYPFIDGSTLSNGANTLPSNFIVDAVFSGGQENRRYKASQIEVVSTSVIQVRVFDDLGVLQGVCNVTGPLPTRYQAQFFQPEATSTLRGKLVFGVGVSEVLSWGLGVYHYGFSSTEFLPSVIGSQPGFTGVTSLGVFGNTQDRLTGDVSLQGGDGVTLTTVPSLNTIRIDLSKKYELNCPDQLDKFDRCTNCIKYINGIPPRADGTFEIVGSQWITVENDPGNNRIVVKFDVDVDACCGACDEVQALITQVNQLQTSIAFLANHVNSLP